MLDMGFEEDMEQILSAAPTPRQTVFFSATFPRSIADISRAHQRDPVRIAIDDGAQQMPDIRQLLAVAEPEQRLRTLRWVLGHCAHESALVFCNFKSSVAELDKALSKAGMSVASLHGDLEQYDRDQVMAKFRNASTRILVATDVAARGIDVQNLDLVINFELPSQPEVYVHRIGRTGRAGTTGQAVSLASVQEHAKIRAIEELTGVALERLSMAGAGEPSETAGAEQALTRDARMDTLRISGGRKDKVRPGDVLGALTGEAGGLHAGDIGRIEIHDHFCYVAVARTVSQTALDSLGEGRIKGRKFRVQRVQ